MEPVIMYNLCKLAKRNKTEVLKYENTFSPYSLSLEVLNDLSDSPKALKFVLDSIKKFEEEEINSEKTISDNYKSDLRIEKESEKIGTIVAIVYALNPFSILSCVGESLSVYTSLSTILSARYAIEGIKKKCVQSSCYIFHILTRFPLNYIIIYFIHQLSKIQVVRSNLCSC